MQIYGVLRFISLSFQNLDKDFFVESSQWLIWWVFDTSGNGTYMNNLNIYTGTSLLYTSSVCVFSDISDDHVSAMQFIKESSYFVPNIHRVSALSLRRITQYDRCYNCTSVIWQWSHWIIDIVPDRMKYVYWTLNMSHY